MAFARQLNTLHLQSLKWVLVLKNLPLKCMQVTHKQTRASSGEEQQAELVPAWRSRRSPCESALRHRPAAQYPDTSPYQQRPDVQAARYTATGSPCCSPQRSQHPYQHSSSSMDVLCKDMQQLDAQIADLDLNLASASHRLHR